MATRFLVTSISAQLAAPSSTGGRSRRVAAGGRWAISLLCALLASAVPAHAAGADDRGRSGRGTVASHAGAGVAAVVVTIPADIAAFEPNIVSGAPIGLGEEAPDGPGEVVEFYALDAIGSVRMVFDPAGTVVGEATYNPFGTETAGTVGMPSQRFTGQERDHEAGLDFFNARAYQVRAGRFSSPDPLPGEVTSPQSWNRYSYARNNPLAFTDRTGLQLEFGCRTITLDGEVFRNVCDGVTVTSGGGDSGGGGGFWSSLWSSVSHIGSRVGDMLTFGSVLANSDLYPQKTERPPAWVENATEWGLLGAAVVLPLGKGKLFSGLSSAARAETAAKATLGLAEEVMVSRITKPPTFIVSEGGVVFPVPRGASGPFPTANGKGFKFEGGSGGYGLDPKVTDLRIMDPITSGKYQYPNGYGSYGNAAGQTVSPRTGQTISKSDPLWHIPAK